MSSLIALGILFTDGATSPMNIVESHGFLTARVFSSTLLILSVLHDQSGFASFGEMNQWGSAAGIWQELSTCTSWRIMRNWKGNSYSAIPFVPIPSKWGSHSVLHILTLFLNHQGLHFFLACRYKPSGETFHGENGSWIHKLLLPSS